MRIHKKCFSPQGFALLKDLKPLVRKMGAVLAGGTALALQIGHRISEDLDYFTTKSFNNDELLAYLKQCGRSYQVLQDNDGTLTAIADDVKVSFFKYQYQFSEVNDGMASLLDIAGMKIIAICQCGCKRDFVDLYFLLQIIPFHHIVQHMYQKFGSERINPVHIGKALVHFMDADGEPEPRYVHTKKVRWETIKNFFEKHVKQMVLDLSAQ